MAVATATPTVTEEHALPSNAVLVVGTIAVSPSADTYAVGGLALGTAEFRNKVKLSPEKAPKFLLATGKAGYHFEYDRVAAKLLVRAQTSAPAEDAVLGELAAAAIPGALSGDTINFVALFDKLG